VNPADEVLKGSFLAVSAHNPILYRALKKYILLARGELQLLSLDRYAEILRSSIREVTAVNPDSKSNMVILGEERLDNLQRQYNEYRDVQLQDGQGPNCNYVIFDKEIKKPYFFTRFIGAQASHCAGEGPLNQELKSSQHQQETTTIPKTLYFAARHELGNRQEGENKHYDNILNTVRAYQSAWGIDKVDYRILDTKFCKNTLEKVDIAGASSVLISYYLEQAKVNPGTSFDVCRAAILHEQGGYFFNSEVEVVEPYTVKSDIEYVGVKSLAGSFLQSFIASIPKHPITKFILMKYIMLAEAMLSPESPDQAGQIYKDSYDSQKKDTLSKAVLLEETHLSVIDKEYREKPKRKPKCSFVIFDPESKNKILFYTRMFVDGEFCVDN